jgi:hypothetical protein
MSDLRTRIADTLARWQGDKADRRHAADALMDVVGPIQARLDFCLRHLVANNVWTEEEIDKTMEARKQKGFD